MRQLAPVEEGGEDLLDLARAGRPGGSLVAEELLLL